MNSEPSITKACRLIMVWLMLMTLVLSPHADANEYPIRLVPFTAVRLTDTFWSPRLATNRAVTTAHNLAQMEKQGTLGGFRMLSGDASVKYHGYMWGDSDLYKTIEGMVYTLRLGTDPVLERRMDELISTIASAQSPDGYLFPHLQITETNYVRFSEETSRTCESYSLGHLIESAAEHFALTGRTNYLAVALKAADLLAHVHAEGKLLQSSGHPEVELALIKLYRATGRREYFDLAASLVNNTRKQVSLWSQGKPPLGDDDLHGHAVAMFYLYAAATDVATLTGDQSLADVLSSKWERMVRAKLYLTGGIGNRRHGEGFASDYDLPNGADAYCETCAGIAGILWQARLFLARGDAKYFDVMERTLYNNVSAAAGWSGDRFFYVNPLASDGRTKFNCGLSTRFAWTDCPCCPVNLVRFWPRLADYVYATGPADLYVNLFVASQADAVVSGTPVKVTQQTDYPWDGRIAVEVAPEQPAGFSLRLRIPGWATGQPLPSDLYRHLEPPSDPVTLQVNGERIQITRDRGYAVIRRTWRAGDQVELRLPMPVRRVLAHAQIVANTGRVAVERGPLVYCAEGVDNGGKAQDLVLRDTDVFKAQKQPGWLNAPVVLKADDPDRPLTLVPYYAWNYRGEGEMAVWLIRTNTPPAPKSNSR